MKDVGKEFYKVCALTVFSYNIKFRVSKEELEKLKLGIVDFSLLDEIIQLNKYEVIRNQIYYELNHFLPTFLIYFHIFKKRSFIECLLVNRPDYSDESKVYTLFYEFLEGNNICVKELGFYNDSITSEISFEGHLLKNFYTNKIGSSSQNKNIDRESEKSLKEMPMNEAISNMINEKEFKLTPSKMLESVEKSDIITIYLEDFMNNSKFTLQDCYQMMLNTTVKGNKSKKLLTFFPKAETNNLDQTRLLRSFIAISDYIMIEKNQLYNLFQINSNVTLDQAIAELNQKDNKVLKQNRTFLLKDEFYRLHVFTLDYSDFSIKKEEFHFDYGFKSKFYKVFSQRSDFMSGIFYGCFFALHLGNNQNLNESFNAAKKTVERMIEYAYSDKPLPENEKELQINFKRNNNYSKTNNESIPANLISLKKDKRSRSFYLQPFEKIKPFPILKEKKENKDTNLTPLKLPAIAKNSSVSVKFDESDLKGTSQISDSPKKNGRKAIMLKKYTIKLDEGEPLNPEFVAKRPKESLSFKAINDSYFNFPGLHTGSSEDRGRVKTISPQKLSRKTTTNNSPVKPKFGGITLIMQDI